MPMGPGPSDYGVDCTCKAGGSVSDSGYSAKLASAMTVRELMECLSRQDPDAKVSIFANGESYPALQVQNMQEIISSNEVEIGGGWEKLPEPN